VLNSMRASRGAAKPLETKGLVRLVRSEHTDGECRHPWVSIPECGAKARRL